MAEVAKKSAQWCQRHWQMVLDDDKAIPFAVSYGAVQFLVNDEGFQRMCGADPEKGVRAGTSAATMNRAVRSIGKVCCYLGDKAVQDLILMSHTPSPEVRAIHEKLLSASKARRSGDQSP